MRTDSQSRGRLPGLRRRRDRTAWGVGSAFLVCLALSANAGALPEAGVPLAGPAVELPLIAAGASESLAVKSTGLTPLPVTALSVAPPSVTPPPVGPPGVQPPELAPPPRLEVPSLEAPKPNVPSLLPSGGRSTPSSEQPSSGDRRPDAGRPAIVPVLAAPTRGTASTRAAGRYSAKPGTPAGSGGVLAQAQKSGYSEQTARSRASHRGASGGATALRRPSGFALVAAPASRPAAAVGGTSSPGGLAAALEPLRGQSSLDLAAWLADILAGLALIGLMCADALGVGPRHHTYPRRARRAGRRWPRWR